MDGIRAKLTPTLVNDLIHLKIEWVILKDSKVVETLESEEFQISTEKAEQGCSYITRGVFQEGLMTPGTFWIDEQGLRHFFLNAEPGDIPLTLESLSGEVG